MFIILVSALEQHFEWHRMLKLNPISSIYKHITDINVSHIGMVNIIQNTPKIYVEENCVNLQSFPSTGE